jgi:hypothetical protein
LHKILLFGEIRVPDSLVYEYRLKSVQIAINWANLKEKLFLISDVFPKKGDDKCTPGLGRSLILAMPSS